MASAGCPSIRPVDELTNCTRPSATAITASEPFSSSAAARRSAASRSACWSRRFWAVTAHRAITTPITATTDRPRAMFTSGATALSAKYPASAVAPTPRLPRAPVVVAAATVISMTPIGYMIPASGSASENRNSAPIAVT
jgi:hypothetical protein